jgi:hypothetical protein
MAISLLAKKKEKRAAEKEKRAKRRAAIRGTAKLKDIGK